MTQTLATFIFFIVFIELFIALSLYIAKTVYDYYKSIRKPEAKDNDYSNRPPSGHS